MWDGPALTVAVAAGIAAVEPMRGQLRLVRQRHTSSGHMLPREHGRLSISAFAGGQARGSMSASGRNQGSWFTDKTEFEIRIYGAKRSPWNGAKRSPWNSALGAPSGKPGGC